MEGSERMAATALDVIAANRLDAAAGGPIEVVVGRIEDLQSLPVDKVGRWLSGAACSDRAWMACGFARALEWQECCMTKEVLRARAVQSAHPGAERGRWTS